MAVTDSSGTRTHVYAYDDIYQITEVNYPAELSYLATDTTFNYDAAGNRTSVIDGSGTCTYTTNNLNQYTAAGPISFQYDDSGNLTHDNNYAYGYDPENRLVKVVKSGSLPPLTLAEAVDLPLTFTTGGDGSWVASAGGYYGNDSAHSPELEQDEESWLQTTVEGSGTVSFWAKIEPADAGNELKFYVDGQLCYSCESEEWEDFSWNITTSGTHTLRWVYTRYSESTAGVGYVDYLQWTGTMPFVPEPDTDDWKVLTYTYNASGRRIAKSYDGDVILKYVYDGDHCIAEYDAFGSLHRKYIMSLRAWGSLRPQPKMLAKKTRCCAFAAQRGNLGPGVDEPICMIEATQTPAATYYYHFDGLGSCVALTNSSGNTIEVYEYDVYGRVGASDANHPNRIMFTGREFDKETGLYYYRARCYNPQIGRFLQTDPVGYGAGMNLYAYCGNNSTNCVDPTGLYGVFLDQDDPMCVKGRLTFAWVGDDGKVEVLGDFANIDDWIEWARNDPWYGGRDESSCADRPGWKRANGNENETLFWYIQAAIFLTTDLVGGFDLADIIAKLEDDRWGVRIGPETGDGPRYDGVRTIEWNFDRGDIFTFWTEDDPMKWWACPNLASFVHEVGHAYETYIGSSGADPEIYAMGFENICRYAFYRRVPGCREDGPHYVAPRPAYGLSGSQEFKDVVPWDISHRHPDVSWSNWNWQVSPL